MSKSKAHFIEENEMSDANAIEHSRAKFARYDDKMTKPGEKSKNDDEDDKEDPVYESKHTLDSDEEDEMKYEKLDISRVEGQEEATQEYEGETKITAFNMNEDLEEGHFDSTGTFIFNKKEREIRDEWLDNINWAGIKQDAGEHWQNLNSDSNDSIPKIVSEAELKMVYEQIITMLQPNETVEKALKRLGKRKGLTAAEERKRRWAAKKAGTEYVDESSDALKQLTGLADSLVSRGEMEAYQYSLERLRHEVQGMEHKAADTLDIFAEAESSFSLKEGAVKNTEIKNANDAAVSWEYKMLAEENACVNGPISTETILKMQEDGAFNNGGWARKYGTDRFYSIARLDFELYL